MANRVEIPIVVLDSNSPTSPVAGATAVVLNRAGGTEATVYSNKEGGGTITQPLTSDEAGRLTGWLERGAYEVQITVPGKVPFIEYLDVAPGSDGAITTTWIADAAVTTPKIADEAVETGKLKNDAVTAAKIATNAVGSSEIAENAVGSSEIGPDAVGSSEVATGAIGPTELASNAVETVKVKDGAITSRKFKPIIGTKESTGIVNLESSLKDISGCTLEITPEVSSLLFVTAHFYLGPPEGLLTEEKTYGSAQGVITLDGTNKGKPASHEWPNWGEVNVPGIPRSSVGTSVVLSLTPEAHTIKLRAQRVFATVATCREATFVYMLVAA